DIQSVKLHYYLEIGASDERMMALLNLGLSRETAKELHDKLPKSSTIESIGDLEKAIHTANIDSLHAIIKKEITNLLSRD
ncbi:hypothetical protein AHW95_24455, partial [Salmonella enterica subsp. enterica]|nr:hypothetical protein [Salmonella enterica subsp. enterica]